MMSEESVYGPILSTLAQYFVGVPTFVLANAQDHWDSRVLNENLRKAMDPRAISEQAEGIIMASRHCSPAGAFAVLVEQSQHENAKLRDVASWIVRDVTRR